MDYLKLASLKLLLLFSVLAWAVNSSDENEKQNISVCPNSCICGTTSTLRSVLSRPDSMENSAINCTGNMNICTLIEIRKIFNRSLISYHLFSTNESQLSL